MEFIKTSRQIVKNIKNVKRLKQIISVFAKHGFQDIINRLNLKLTPKIFSSKKNASLPTEARIRMSFEELGPTFVKLGQLFSTRPDLIPIEWVEEFKKLQDQVETVPFDQIKLTLDKHFKNFDNTFLNFDKNAKGAASIAQVHNAQLKDGTHVVVKIRRPNITKQIKDDLDILAFISGLIQKYIPETRIYNPKSMVQEFSKTLNLETNFIVEANNMIKFQQNFKDNPDIIIPKVFLDLSGSEVLVMEKIDGVSLGKVKGNKSFDTEVLFKNGMKAFFSMVFNHRVFHGDLHAGNIFALEGNKIALLDFGVVGRLSPRVRDSLAEMFVAITTEDYDTLAHEFVDLSPYNDKIDFDLFSKELRDFISPHFNLSLKYVNFGKVLMEATGLAVRHNVSVPADLVLFFKSILTLEGVGKLLVSDFDLLSEANEFAKYILKAKYDTSTIRRNISSFSKETKKLLTRFPREINQLIKKFSHPSYKHNLNLLGFSRFVRVFEKSAFLFFLGFVICGLLIASSIALNYDVGVNFLGLPIVSGIGYLVSFILVFFSLFFIRK